MDLQRLHDAGGAVCRSLIMDSDKPNVLWIFADQMRHHALACNGDPNVKTPNLDRLAREGVTCETAVSHYPVCMPFRAGLVTGQYAHVHGCRVHGDLLAADTHTVAHTFQEAGYRTSYVGKLHLASTNSYWNDGKEFWVPPRMRAGFEDFFGFDLSNHYFNTHYCTGATCKAHKVEGHQTDGLTDISLRYLKEQAIPAGKPWFHVIAYEAPHHGIGNEENRFPVYSSTPEYEALYEPSELILRDNVPEPGGEEVRAKTAGYYALITPMDHNIGRLIELLERTNQLENTLVVFFSDHGDMMGSQGLFFKERAYDESIRIPLIFRMPVKLEAGTRCDTIFSGIDIYPTCTGLCGIAKPTSVQGLDQSRALQGLPGGARRSEALVQWLGETMYGWGDWPYRAIRTDRYTYCTCSEETATKHQDHGPHYRLLFDNREDPHQLKNLYGKAEAAPLQEQLHQRLCHAVLESGEDLPDFLVG